MAVGSSPPSLGEASAAPEDVVVVEKLVVAAGEPSLPPSVLLIVSIVEGSVVSSPLISASIAT